MSNKGLTCVSALSRHQFSPTYASSRFPPHERTELRPVSHVVEKFLANSRDFVTIVSPQLLQLRTDCAVNSKGLSWKRLREEILAIWCGGTLKPIIQKLKEM